MLSPATHRRQVLVVALATVCLLFVQLLQATAAEAAPARTDLELLAEEVLAELHNDARSNPGSYGYGGLASAPSMQAWTDIREVSRDWSDQMAAETRMYHNPDYANQYCCWTAVGENVAWASVSQLTASAVESRVRTLFQMWMDSDGHRTNIMTSRYDHFAVGVRIAPHPTYGYAIWATANFRDWDGTPPPGTLVDGTSTTIDADLDLVDRLSGGDPVGNGVEVALATFGSAETVLLATSEKYPDALAAASLAGLHDAPLLLTPSSSLDSRVADAVRQLRASEVVILGGPQAVSDQVASAVRSQTGASTRRVYGNDRFETAVAVARELHQAGAPMRRAYVVEGAHVDPSRGWPDALSASSIAARTDAPILLVTQDDAPDDTVAALRDLGIGEAVVIGGPVAVSEGVLDQLGSAVRSVSRWSGADRFATSATAAARSGLDASAVYVATGHDFRDALVAGPAAARDAGLMLLVHGTIPDGATPVYDYVQSNHRGVPGFVVGAPGTVTDEVAERLGSALTS